MGLFLFRTRVVKIPFKADLPVAPHTYELVFSGKSASGNLRESESIAAATLRMID